MEAMVLALHVSKAEKTFRGRAGIFAQVYTVAKCIKPALAARIISSTQPSSLLPSVLLSTCRLARILSLVSKAASHPTVPVLFAMRSPSSQTRSTIRTPRTSSTCFCWLSRGSNGCRAMNASRGSSSLVHIPPTCSASCSYSTMIPRYPRRAVR